MTEHVPGEFHCPECGFVVVKSILYAQTGAVGADSRDTLETCPNDGTILRPVKWDDALREARDEARDDAIKFMAEVSAAKELIAKANQAIREACRLLSDHGSVFLPAQLAMAKKILLDMLVELP